MGNVKIKAIFFDIGDVLAKEGLSIGVRGYEQQHNIPPGQLYAAIHDHSYWKDFSLGKIDEEAYFQSVAASFDGPLNIKELRETILDSFVINGGLLEYLKLLGKNYFLGIISNHPKGWFDYFSKLFKFDEIFRVSAISGYLHVRKPDKEIFEQALTLAKVNPEEAIYIDDRQDMTEEAASLGIKVIVYQGLDNLKEELKNFQCAS